MSEDGDPELPGPYGAFRDEVGDELRFDVGGLLHAQLAALGGQTCGEPLGDAIWLLNRCDSSPTGAPSGHAYGPGASPPEKTPPEVALAVGILELAENMRLRLRPAARRALRELGRAFEQCADDLNVLREMRHATEATRVKLGAHAGQFTPLETSVDQLTLSSQADALWEVVSELRKGYSVGQRGAPERRALTDLELCLRNQGGYSDAQVVALVDDRKGGTAESALRRLRRRRAKRLKEDPAATGWGRR